MKLRLSRLRQTAASRALVRETHLHPAALVAPLFISETLSKKREIKSMPGQFQLTLADLPETIAGLQHAGVGGIILFGIPAEKDEEGSRSYHPEGIIQQAIRQIRATHPEMLIIADACFCEYTSHGHCGILKDQVIDNPSTLLALGKQAVSYAEAGADWIAPSGMTDGMVGAIREALDTAGFLQTAILSYAVKYASNLYGPFREAAEGAPRFGNRTCYQMDPANAQEALREASLDIEEGADLIMVKPAAYYLDIIYRIKARYPEVPLGAYQVSGEYAMIKAGAAQGFFHEEQAMLESLLAIKRAGADFIITYYAKAMAEYLSN